MTATAVKERPILMSSPMVRAILDGRKTQTRRVCKPLVGATGVQDVYHRPDGQFIGLHLPRGAGVGVTLPFHCPYGCIGERLWVRESFCLATGPGGPDDVLVLYKANPEDHVFDKWKPSIHMPRIACRITLEITDVRIERLQAISEEAARDEGCPGENVKWSSPYIIGAHTDDGLLPSEQFRELWDSINGKKHPWTSNPWVWAITFKRQEN